MKNDYLFTLEFANIYGSCEKTKEIISDKDAEKAFERLKIEFEKRNKVIQEIIDVKKL